MKDGKGNALKKERVQTASAEGRKKNFQERREPEAVETPAKLDFQAPAYKFRPTP